MNIFKNRTVILYFLIIILLSGYYIYASDWFYIVDEIAHYLHSRHALDAPQAILGPWHRLGRVFLFFIPAQAGPVSIKMTAGLIFILMLYFLYRIADLQKIKHAEFIILLVGLQPMLFDVSYTCMAELPAAFIITIAYYFFLKEKYQLSIFISSLVFLFRTEMYFFSFILVLAVFIKTRNYKIILPVFAGPAIWWLITYLLTFDPILFFREFSRFSKLEKYKEGIEWEYYIFQTPEIFGVIQTIFFVLGAVIVMRIKGYTKYLLLCTILFTFFINTLSAVRYFHFSGSVGDSRYLVPIAPLFGLVSLLGLSFVLQKFRKDFFLYTFSGVIILLLIYNCITITKPHRMESYYQNVINLLEKTKNDSEAFIFGNNFVIPYVLDESPLGSGRFKAMNMDNIIKYSQFRHYLIWDPRFANSPFTQKYLRFLELKKTYKLVDSSESIEGKFYLLLKE